MPVSLRPFQADLERRVYEQWAAGAVNVMGVAATGSGKTVLLSKLLYDEPGASVAIAHRQELVGQISTALARNGVKHRVVGAKKGSPLVRAISAIHIYESGYSFFDPNAKTGVGGVDTIVRMPASEPWFQQVRLVVQDEAHHVLAANKWGKAAALFPNARGFYPTATPLRADGKGLGRHADGLMDAMVLAPSMRDIIDMGYLTDYRIFAPPSDLDLSGVALSSATGDFNADQVRKAVHKSHITGDVVQHYRKLAPGKLGVTFAVDVEAATEIAAAFRAQGVAAEVVSAKTPDGLRAQILRDFKARKILQLVNVDLFGEGFDLPAIEVVSFARPTESFALYCQQFGRALRLMLTPELARGWDLRTDESRREAIRASDKPCAIIIDHVNNVQRHGLPDARREWSLDARERRGSSGPSDAIPLRTCVAEGCFTPYPRVYRCCPACGHYPEPAERSSPKFVDGDLAELDADTLRAMRGEIERVDGAAIIPRGVDAAVAGAIKRRHWERQQAQGQLRNVIAWWAGLESAQGRGESESYRRFYFKYGVDVASAQTLNAREAGELAERVAADLSVSGIDGTVNAAAYYAYTNT